MFETGMSALVLKICSEYAKSLGLNFPPCTQQEINAICQWVDKHTVKDLTMEQNGDSVTFRFVTENETVKEFTFTIPEQKVDVNVLEQLLIGSETVVVERTEDNSKLQVRLTQNVTNQINGKLDKPATPTAESAVIIRPDGGVGTKRLSNIGIKLYRHRIMCSNPSVIFTINADIITSYSEMTESKFKKYIENQIVGTCYDGNGGNGVVTISYDSYAGYIIQGVGISNSNPQTTYIINRAIKTFENFSDTKTEI